MLIWLSATFIACLLSVAAFFLFYADRSNLLLTFTLSHYGTLPPGNYPRIQSSFLNPNMFCNYLSFGLIFLLSLFRLNLFKETLFYILFSLLSVACALTISPNLGGIILIIGLWLFVIFKENNRRRAARFSLFAGIFAAVLFFFSTLGTPIASATSPFYFKIPYLETRLDPTSRVLAWQSAFGTWQENPFFGKGVGTDAARVEYLNPSGTLETLTDAHQMWLNVAAQTGISGFAALCFLCYFFLRRAKSFSFADQQSVLETAFAIAFIGFLYQSLSGSYEDARHFWVFLGLFAAAGRHDFED